MATGANAERLCCLLATAANRLAKNRGPILSSYDSGEDIATFVLECKVAIELGNIELTQKRKLWGIFAPACDWDDVVGDADLGNQVFSLLDELYRDEIIGSSAEGNTTSS